MKYLLRKKYYDKNIYILFDNLVKRYIKYRITLSFLLVRRKTIYFRKYISIIFIQSKYEPLILMTFFLKISIDILHFKNFILLI